ncbi:hypothetical protein C1881_10415 [Slackia isoflavoniconvertens]|uniref:GmrSD restriction endonucleases N-terminal domain-containing protein n=2 Tax=Slackia isoflavoniconvertens TaxID=572010 RepID=A0A369L6K2_9ACTN|nr:hypothetical protein C1881_10415 [Slackia isoflavoniconvertens]
MAYPMGAVMCLENGGDFKLKRRCFAGVEIDAETVEPDKLVLDGQQRLTSLYLSLCCKKPVHTKNARGDERRLFYYADIRACLDGGVDRVDAIVSVPANRIVTQNIGRDILLDISTQEKEIEQMMFPLNIAFDASERQSWYKGIVRMYGFDSPEESLFNEFQHEVLDTIESYRLPVITLSKATPREAVCRVFENVNTGGVPPTVFELVTASFAMDGFRLRDDWEKRFRRIKEDQRVVTDILDKLDATTFLTAVTLYASFMAKQDGKGFVGCKKKDVLALDLDSYKLYADAVQEGFVLAAEFLIVNEHIFRARDLPYSTQLIPLACAFAHAKNSGLANKQTTKDVLHRWLWCGILGEMYGGANETRYANDMEDLAAAIGGSSSQVRTVNAAYFQTPRLLGLQTRNSAAYKGIMALIYRKNCRDFISGQPTNAFEVMAKRPDIHHIFPEAYCIKMGLDRTRWNSIVNKTPLLPSTNRTIGGKAPSEYFQRICRECPNASREELASRIESHLVEFDSFINNDFDTYFTARARALLDLIEDAMGKPVSDRASDEVVAKFGASLE